MGKGWEGLFGLDSTVGHVSQRKIQLENEKKQNQIKKNNICLAFGTASRVAMNWRANCLVDCAPNAMNKEIGTGVTV